MRAMVSGNWMDGLWVGPRIRPIGLNLRPEDRERYLKVRAEVREAEYHGKPRRIATRQAARRLLLGLLNSNAAPGDPVSRWRGRGRSPG